MSASTQDRAERPQRRSGVQQGIAIGYAALAYVAFVGVAAYSIAFLAHVAVPRTVDGGGPESALTVAIVIDAALLGIFAVQHSVMARPAFKRWWTRFVPPHLERATYVLATSAALALLFWWWHPITTVVWDLDGDALRAVVWALYGVGWATVIAMTFAIDHLDLFGISQVVHRTQDNAPGSSELMTPLPYRLVRHPMMTGFMVAFVATPTMTVGHLLFAVLGCGYIVVAVRLEERDLARDVPGYATHAADLPRFCPMPTRSAPRSPTQGAGRLVE